MKDWYDKLFAALKSWPVGAVLCLSTSANIYLALWLRAEITDEKRYQDMVIQSKNEVIKSKEALQQSTEEENRDLKRKIRELSPIGGD